MGPKDVRVELEEVGSAGVEWNRIGLVFVW